MRYLYVRCLCLLGLLLYLGIGPNVTAQSSLPQNLSLSTSPLEEWTVEDVSAFIRTLPEGYGLDALLFEAEEVDGFTLRMLTTTYDVLLSSGAALGLRTLRQRVALMKYVDDLGKYDRSFQPAPPRPLNGATPVLASRRPSTLPAQEDRPSRPETREIAEESSLDEQVHVTNLPDWDCEISGECGSDLYNKLWVHLMDKHNRYVPPTDVTIVRFQIQFQKIRSVDMQTTVMTLHVWYGLEWKDPRLSWDPTDFGGINSTRIQPSELWTPDIELWNGDQTLDESMGQQLVALHVLCKLGGLEVFPFDYMTCAMEFGSWTRGKDQLDLRCFGNGCIRLYGSYTSGSTFQEYQLEKFEGEVYTYPVGSFRINPYTAWPTIRLEIVTTRTMYLYVGKVLVPQVFLSLLSGAVFWMGVPCGERLGFGITLILACVAYDLLILDKVPTSNKVLWLEQMGIVANVFCAISLLESCLVTGIHFSTSYFILNEKHWLFGNNGFLALLYKRVNQNSLYGGVPQPPARVLKVLEQGLHYLPIYDMDMDPDELERMRPVQGRDRLLWDAGRGKGVSAVMKKKKRSFREKAAVSAGDACVKKGAAAGGEVSAAAHGQHGGLMSCVTRARKSFDNQRADDCQSRLERQEEVVTIVEEDATNTGGGLAGSQNNSLQHQLLNVNFVDATSVPPRRPVANKCNDGDTKIYEKMSFTDNPIAAPGMGDTDRTSDQDEDEDVDEDDDMGDDDDGGGAVKMKKHKGTAEEVAKIKRLAATRRRMSTKQLKALTDAYPEDYHYKIPYDRWDAESF
eukprot:gene8285-9840_t